MASDTPDNDATGDNPRGQHTVGDGTMLVRAQ